ncbi:hypothetical protein G9A89_007415 [Geosiphon pyriformis]|nr:hypothetical protein G9A89_007415 [Geosiphon pyriformis]
MDISLGNRYENINYNGLNHITQDHAANLSSAPSELAGTHSNQPSTPRNTEVQYIQQGLNSRFMDPSAQTLRQRQIYNQQDLLQQIANIERDLLNSIQNLAQLRNFISGTV